MLKELTKVLKKIHAKNVLDIATGAGDFIGFIKEFASYNKITAIDCEKKMGEIISKKFKDDKTIEFIQMDAENLLFESEVFDTVCISNSLHHFHNPQKALMQAKNILKKNGYFIINEMRSNNLSKAQKSHDLIHRFWAKLDRLNNRCHNDPFSADEIKWIINILELKDIQIFEYEFVISKEQSNTIIQRLANAINEQLEKISSSNKYYDLKYEADQIVAYLNKFGYSPASSLFIIGRR